MRSLITTVIVLAAVVGGVALVYGMVSENRIVVQPIAFNHAVHLDEAHLQCVDCHLNAETSVFAGLPGKDVCLDCHDSDEESGSNPEKDKLFTYEDSDDDIPWVRVAITRPDVFFSHRRHVASGKMECLDCHANQPTLTTPPSTVRPVMRMTACLACHEKHGITGDCLHCHR